MPGTKRPRWSRSSFLIKNAAAGEIN